MFSEPIRGSSDLATVLSPLFPISRFLGVLPYSDTFGVSKGWLIYSVALHITLLAVTIFHRVYLAVWSGSGYNRYNFLQDFEITINYVTIITHIVQLSLLKQSLGSVLRKTAEIDTFWVVYTKHYARKYFIGGTLWLWFPVAVLSISKDLLPPSYKRYGVEHLIALNVFLTIVMIICSFLELLRCHLKCITDQLQPKKAHLSHLIETHNTIVRLASSINEFFSWQILWICIRCSVTFVIDIFLLLKIVSTTDLKESYVEMILAISNSFWDILVLFLLSSSCSKTSEHLGAFNSHLFKIVHSHSTLYKDEKLRLYTILRECHDFNACGYFTVGYPLITSVIGATTTYVVILVQFLVDTGGVQEAVTASSPNETEYYEYS